MKHCSTCKEVKPLEDFHNDKGTKTGKSSRCKPCTITQKRNWNRKNKEKVHGQQIKQKYGIGLEEFNAMYKAQGGCCAICKTDKNDFRVTSRQHYRFAVDHCHETGKVRGLLCNACNRGIGFLKDDADLLEAAASYLRSGGAN